jgi:hypothetical protein
MTRFQEQWALPFLFEQLGLQRSWPLDWDSIIEVSKYLTLNKAIEAFSWELLPRIKEKCLPLHLTNRSESLLLQIIDYIDTKSVRSLSLDRLELAPDYQHAMYDRLTAASSLQLLNFEHAAHICDLLNRFRGTRCLSLWFNHKLELREIFVMEGYSSYTITHLRIHCAGVECEHGCFADDEIYFNMPFLRYFLFDVGHYLIPSSNECLIEQATCFLQQAARLIQAMPSVEVVRFRIASHQLDKILHVQPWIDAVQQCYRLRKIVLHILDTNNEDLWTDRVTTIERSLQMVRKTITFSMRFE